MMSTNPGYLVLACIVGALLWIGCTEPNPFYEAQEDPCGQGQLVIEPFNLALPYQVDILFVVDNSSGMLEVQRALSAAMPDFVESLDAVDGLDYHLGVISTDVVSEDPPGELQTGMTGQTGCPGNRQRIITRQTPGGPIMAACNVMLGESGDNFEAGLQAVRYALTGPASEIGGANEGFLRSDSRVVAIFFSNENDCSEYGDLARDNPAECEWDRDLLAPLSDYVSPRRFGVVRVTHGGSPVDIVAVVGPDDGYVYERPEAPQPVCAANGSAFNGRRYLSVVEAMEERGGFYNICNRSYATVLQEIFEEHILPRPEVVCPQLHLTQTPVSVRAVNPQSDSDTVISLPEDPTGFLFLGPDDVCGTGRVLIAPDLHGSLGEGEELQVFYCTEDTLP